MISVFTRSSAPKGYVKVKVENTLTGEVYEVKPHSWKKLFEAKNISDFLDNIAYKIKKYGKNTATLDARKISARRLEPLNNDYAIHAMVWGYGNTIPTNPRNVQQLVGNFDPVVRTPITSYTYPTTDGNVIKFISVLAETLPQYPEGSGQSGTPLISEVGLVSNPIVGESPDEGLLLARYVLDSPIPKGDTFLRLTTEWNFIYT